MKIGEKIRYQDLIKWTSTTDYNKHLSLDKNTTFISSISTDTRTIKRGDFFVPIVGENFDGHDFILQAIKKGCSGFVFQDNNLPVAEELMSTIAGTKAEGLLVLKTVNTIDFLMDLAKNYIRQFKLKAIGITGSVGKTTSKNFLVNILSDCFNLMFTPKNYNTEIGITRSVLKLNRNTQIFIAELGMRAKGQIMKLCKVIDPKIGAITTISRSHLEFFESLEDIAIAKGEIGIWLKKREGILFLNNDDRWTDFIIKKTGCRILKYGKKNNIDYGFIEKNCDDLGRYSFDFYVNEFKTAGIKLNIAGFHNIYNACCAASIAHYLGVSHEKIKSGIENTCPEEKRMNIFSKSGKIIINDCYNANPLSMEKAVDTLKLVAKRNDSRSVAILSDMLELGKKSNIMHFGLGKYVFDSNIDVLITVGQLSENISDGFRSALAKKNNMVGSKKFYHYRDKESLQADLTKILKEKDTVLIKGSRSNRLETILDFV